MDTDQIDEEQTAEDAEDTGATEEADQEAAAHWLDGIEGVSDEDRAFVGEHSPTDLVAYARQQRQAASRRADDVAKEKGMVAPIGQDASGSEVETFFERFRPENTDAYLQALGKDEANTSTLDRIEMEAAHASGLHVGQVQKFYEARAAAQAEQDQENAKQLSENLRGVWGADFDRNVQSVGRGLDALGLGKEFHEAVSNPALGLSMRNYQDLMEGFLKLGNFLTEGGPVTAGDTSAQSLDDRIDALEDKKALSDKWSASDERELRSLLMKRADQRAESSYK